MQVGREEEKIRTNHSELFVRVESLQYFPPVIIALSLTFGYYFVIGASDLD